MRELSGVRRLLRVEENEEGLVPSIAGMRKAALLMLVCLVVVSMPKYAFALLTDSDQRECYDETSFAEIPCAGTGQDGAYVVNPLSYTDNGDGTVTDNNTGLMWQKQDDGNLYNWVEAAAVCGSPGLLGYSDWRLPTKKELMGLVNYAIPIPGPTIKKAYFPGTRIQAAYWSSTAYADPLLPDNAWSVHFDDGLSVGSPMGSGMYVRCVRGTETPQNLVDNGNGTVTDNSTRLMWQQGESGQMTWGAALLYCETLSDGTYQDWRLPNIKELESLTLDSAYGPAIDQIFSNAQGSAYWSSTTSAGDPGYAWQVYFDNGNVTYGAKDYDTGMYARCVRFANQKPALGSLNPNAETSNAGSSRTFKAIYRDADGYADLKTVDFLVSPDGKTANAIWVRYDVATNKLMLYNDAGTGLVQGECTPGVAKTLANSQGRLDCKATRVSVYGNACEMRWSIIPKVAFADAATPKQLRMRAVDNFGANTGFKTKGEWTIK